MWNPAKRPTALPFLTNGLQTNLFFISVSHSRFVLLETFSNDFFRGIPRTANLGKSRDLVLIVTFAFCDSSFQQDKFLAVIDLRQRVIARDHSHRSPVWPAISVTLSHLLSIGNNFKSMLNPGFGRVKTPLCPGGRGPGLCITPTFYPAVKCGCARGIGLRGTNTRCYMTTKPAKLGRCDINSANLLGSR